MQEEINPNHIQRASFVIHQVKVCDMPENEKEKLYQKVKELYQYQHF